jgi:2-amino-4-hydroxy-6-hydroxymethyldihydropteridine diphosphokinase
MARVYVGVGSNIDKRFHIIKVLDELKLEFGHVDVSPVYQTAATGFEGEDFYNCVVGFETNLTPTGMFHRLREIEASHLRIRMSQNQFISRTLDLDQLLYADQIVSEPHVQLPSPDIAKYAFVLKPLFDIAPDLIHPQLGLSIKQIWQDFDKTQLNLATVEINAM